MCSNNLKICHPNSPDNFIEKFTKSVVKKSGSGNEKNGIGQQLTKSTSRLLTKNVTSDSDKIADFLF